MNVFHMRMRYNRGIGVSKGGWPALRKKGKAQKLIAEPAFHLTGSKLTLCKWEMWLGNLFD